MEKTHPRTQKQNTISRFIRLLSVWCVHGELFGPDVSQFKAATQLGLVGLACTGLNAVSQPRRKSKTGFRVNLNILKIVKLLLFVTCLREFQHFYNKNLMEQP